MANLRLINNKQNAEKRSFERLPWHSLVELTSDEGFVVCDFNPGGMRVSSKKQILANQPICFSVKTSEKLPSIPLLGKIAWTKYDAQLDEYQSGVCFEGNDEKRKTLMNYIYKSVKHEFKPAIPSFTPVNLLCSLDSEGTSIVERIHKNELPPLYKKLIQQTKLFSKRPDYLWHWCFEAMEATTLSCVDPQYSKILNDTKLAGFMLSILLDDLADERHSSFLLEESIKMILLKKEPDLRRIAEADHAQAEFLNHIWEIIQGNIRQFPRYQEFKDLIQYDFEQVVATLRFANLSNGLSQMINWEETVLYEGNNINVIIDVTMDVMCSPSFDSAELSKLRGVAWHAQMMCKIVNWLATWKREVPVRDWTSGVIAKALASDVISSHDLSHKDPTSIILKITNSSVEEELMWEWEQHRLKIEQYVPKVKSVDLKIYLKSLETFYQMQLASRGLQ